MRWGNYPVGGEYRIIRKFLFLPHFIDHPKSNKPAETRWLEFVKIKQYCSGGGQFSIWQDVEFVDD